MGDLTKNFSRSEFRCNCGKCGLDTIDSKTLEVVQAVRDHFAAPVNVSSGHRCPAWNKRVGGASNSQHLHGRAADISVKGIYPKAVYLWIKSAYPDVSLGLYKGFVHIDTRTSGPAYWDFS